jgi:NTE family protein
MIFNPPPKVQQIALSASRILLFKQQLKTWLGVMLGIYCLILSGCANTPKTPQIPQAPQPPVVSPPVTPPVVVTPSKTPRDHYPRVALVLGGGGARGYAHIGVLKVLQQAGIPIDLIVGSSIGSLVGALYADSDNANQVQKILVAAQEQELINLSLLHVFSGPVSGTRFQYFVTQHLKATTFSELKIPLVAVATDLQTGETIHLRSGLIAPAINASCALPPAFPAVNLSGHLLVDGAIADPVPVDIARQYKPHIVIAVNIAEQLPTDLTKGILGIAQRSTMINLMRYARLSSQNADVVIQPEVGNTGVFDTSRKIALIAAGEAAARQALPRICKLLAAQKINSHCATVLSASNS